MKHPDNETKDVWPSSAAVPLITSHQSSPIITSPIQSLIILLTLTFFFLGRCAALWSARSKPGDATVLPLKSA